jgi:hypothetical protein
MNRADWSTKAAVKEKALIFLKVWRNAFFPYFCTPKILNDLKLKR